MEGLKSGGVGGFSCSNHEDEYWRDSPSLLPEFVHKRDIFVGFLLDSLSYKSIIGVCEFNELYFDVRIRMERWVPLYGMPWAQSMLDLSQALQWHLVWVHEHGSSHCGTVLSGEAFMNLPAFMRV